MSNLAISVRADTGEARAQLALVQSDVRSLGRSLSQAAKEASAAGSGITDAMRQMASQIQAGNSELTKLHAQLRETATSGFAQFNQAITTAAEPLGVLGSSLRKTGEAFAIFYAVDKVREFAAAMAKLGETTISNAFVVGASVKEYAQLSGALQIAGGDADEAVRVIEHLGREIQSALQDPTGAAATAFKNLGISMDQVRTHGKNLTEMVGLIVAKIGELRPGLDRTGASEEVLGRGMQRLGPLLSQGSTGFAELMAAAKDYSSALAENADAMNRSAEKQNRLGLDIKTLGIDAFALLRPLIDDVVGALDGFVNDLDRAIKKVGEWAVASRKAAFEVDNAFYKLFHGDNAALIPPAMGAGPAPGTRDTGTSKPGGARGRGRAGDDQAKQDLEDERDLERELNEESRIRVGNLDAEQRAADINYESQINHLQALVRQGKLSAADALQQELTLNGERWQSDENYLQQKLNLAGNDEAAQQRIMDEELDQTAEFNARIQEITDRTAKDASKAWADAFKQISDQLATLAVDVLDRTKTIGQAFASLAQDVLKSTLKSAIGGVLGGSGGGSGGGAGGGISSLLFGSGGLSGLLGLGSGGIAGLLGKSLGLGSGGLLGGLFGGSSGDQDFFGGVTGAGEDIAGGSGGGGLLGTLFGGIGSLFGFEHGGVVPSAAGGWAVPSLGPGGMLAQVHSNEMVLPAPISQGLQGMIAGGGAGGVSLGGVNISAVDAQGVARLFMTNGSALVAALNRATRNGSMLTQP